ncbi:DNA-3-methyladenine glycosylase family protein [Chelatococcus asaccharovorans]|uniref:DNA-3-methyladenine glycosylase II n=1 Tax=Chelatococcus asaccharovorans TaxID=28210 RepID=A0A2V3TRX0_9HYPH|nr:DNA-3-methyladenine glycosylase [Chelatococcus asaccharovorans]MBS7704533.1 DNA-3-methyladenine glycosylase 2 family protein [Chelatococcus asaccharovorans]PXW50307.1 DNA-3-methyladenine glycosylase II [Chelatococcus asaccharovorans]CAH1648396.1 DNA-3-methyladenine glycosylase II [Chelatococcus asaccharovorans]CAH1687856.1 DNA-3-methyladenine glycosylase II [Chelatococcus asaccharovorans]
MQPISNEETLAANLASLMAHDPLMAQLVAAGATPPLRLRPAGFAGLASIITAQQLSTASANAIWSRLTARFPALQAGDIADADAMELRAAGLSAGKIRTLKALAVAVAEDGLVLDRLHEKSAEDAEKALVAVHGIGKWTAEVYLLFCTGHPDILPAGDLALQEAARLALGTAWIHERRPTEKELRVIAERWRPWRGTAARILWAYYRIAKGREGMTLAKPA